MLCYKLNIAKNDSVLEVGCGGGLQTAMIASIAKRVTSLCATKLEKENAEKNFAKANIRNAFVVRNDFGLGWPVQAPFDKIIVNVRITSYNVCYTKLLRCFSKIFLSIFFL